MNFAEPPRQASPATPPKEGNFTPYSTPYAHPKLCLAIPLH
jgi:hypothetical protein